jgi:hypothetical protein
VTEPWENEDGSTNVDGWLAAYADDNNNFWRTAQGHIMNVVDELIDRSESKFDDRDHVKWHLAQTHVALADLHRVASEEGGLTGAFRDGVFGLSSALDALAALAGLDLTQ